MDQRIYKPLEEFKKKYRPLHQKKTEQFFKDATTRSKVDIAANRKTVKAYHEAVAHWKKVRKTLFWWKFLRVILYILILGIPFVLWKINPKIKTLKAQVEAAEDRSENLEVKAREQVAPLLACFTEKDCLRLAEDTISLLKFFPTFTAQQELDMLQNYDFAPCMNWELSSLDTLSGRYNGNPFLFERRHIHTMGTETYHGYKTISWTEHYVDSEGRARTRRRTQTLHASVVKPKPYYSIGTALHYGAQGGDALSFSRDATNLDRKSERELKRYLKKGEKKLEKMNRKALETGDDFMALSNTEFGVLFDALDRDHEVQYRTLFTPLAQINMENLILSKEGYGDDFHFLKKRRMNTIVTQHSVGRELLLHPKEFDSFAYDEISKLFHQKHAEFFKSVYFDFAPLWAIPIYQERPTHSLNVPKGARQEWALKEYETLANVAGSYQFHHPNSKTPAMLKTAFVEHSSAGDHVTVTAYSYDTAPRVDIVPVFGGDGCMHNVSVPWEEYLPLEYRTNCLVTDENSPKEALSKWHGLCMIKEN
ncbi:MAG: hypothetical protein J6K84_04010 [Oscillospiraceae bacterium]|nr:hypothetical protein [Oscillospiraceae bacterium]